MTKQNSDDVPEVLDEATVEAIKIGLESEKSGEYMSMQEALVYAKARRDQWTKVR